MLSSGYPLQFILKVRELLAVMRVSTKKGLNVGRHQQGLTNFELQRKLLWVLEHMSVQSVLDQLVNAVEVNLRRASHGDQWKPCAHTGRPLPNMSTT